MSLFWFRFSSNILSCPTVTDIVIRTQSATQLFAWGKTFSGEKNWLNVSWSADRKNWGESLYIADTTIRGTEERQWKEEMVNSRLVIHSWKAFAFHSRFDGFISRFPLITAWEDNTEWMNLISTSAKTIHSIDWPEWCEAETAIMWDPAMLWRPPSARIEWVPKMTCNRDRDPRLPIDDDLRIDAYEKSGVNSFSLGKDRA